MTRRVFILGGGAALGAHQVGALRYLEEEGIKPDAIVGSSIGVINACVYGTGGLAALERAWRTFRSLPQIIAPSLTHNPILGWSLFSMERLTASFEEHVDFPGVFASPLDMEFVVLNLSRGVGEVRSKAECADWQEFRTLSRAGYAIPLLFPPVEWRGDWYADGGFAWNIPLERAVALEATEIWLLAPIASQLPYKRTFTTFVDFTQRFVDVMWRTIGNAGWLNALIVDHCFHGIPVTIVEPGEEWSGFGPLAVFQAYPRKNQKLMAAGYRDAKRVVATVRRQRRAGRSSRSAS